MTDQTKDDFSNVNDAAKTYHKHKYNVIKIKRFGESISVFNDKTKQWEEVPSKGKAASTGWEEWQKKRQKEEFIYGEEIKYKKRVEHSAGLFEDEIGNIGIIQGDILNNKEYGVCCFRY